MRAVRLALLLPLIVLIALVGMPLQWLSLKAGWEARRRIPLLFHRILLKLMDVRVHVSGAPSATRPLFLLANHTSWLDIPVLGATLPLCFIAKSEVGQWPGIGTLARLQRTLFVDRARRQATGDVNRAIAARLGEGDPVVLFAEGTSGDGNRVLPFRSALLGAARDTLENGEAGQAASGHVTVQPLAIAYTRQHGLPMGRIKRPKVAWYGDMDLMPHLMGVLRDGVLDVEVRFGPPLAFDPTTNRKLLSREAETAVRRMVTAALTGRDAPAPQ